MKFLHQQLTNVQLKSNAWRSVKRPHLKFWSRTLCANFYQQLWGQWDFNDVHREKFSFFIGVFRLSEGNVGQRWSRQSNTGVQWLSGCFTVREALHSHYKPHCPVLMEYGSNLMVHIHNYHSETHVQQIIISIKRDLILVRSGNKQFRMEVIGDLI